MFKFDQAATTSLISAAQKQTSDQEISRSYTAVKKSYRIDIPKQSAENYTNLLAQLKSKTGLPEAEKTLYGEGTLSLAEQELKKEWDKSLKPLFTLKHGTKNAFEFDVMKSTGQLEAESLAHNNSRTTRNPLKHNSFFVLGLGKNHPTPAFTGGNTEIIGVELGKVSPEQAQPFDGMWISGHLEDYVTSRNYHPVSFAGTQRAILFDKDSFSKTIVYTRPDGTVIKRNIAYKDEIFAVQNSLDEFFDALFYQFILELRYLGPEFHQFVVANCQKTEWMVAIFNQIFQSWIYPEVKLPRPLPLTAPNVWRSKGDVLYYNKVLAYFKAAEKGDCEALEKLLAQGIPVDLLDTDNQTALFHAMNRNQLAAALFLLQKGADPSALFHGSLFGFKPGFFDLKLFDLLLKGTPHTTVPTIRHHVDLNLTKAFKLELIRAAFEKSQGLAHFQYLIKNGLALLPDFPIIALAYRHGGKETVTALMAQHSQSINIPLAGGKTALMLAAEKGDTESCRLLLDNHANPNISLQDDDFDKHAGWTAAHFAAKKGHLEVMQLLQERGANLDAVDEHGDTPFAIVQQVITGGIELYCEEEHISTSLKATYDAASHYGSAESAAGQLNFQLGLHISRWKTYEQKMTALRDFLLILVINRNPIAKTPLQTCTSKSISSAALITGTIKGEPHVVLIKRADEYGQVYGFLMGPGGHKDKTDASTEHTARREMKEEIDLTLPAEHPLSLKYSFQNITDDRCWHQIDFYHCDLGSALESTTFEAGDDAGEVSIVPWSQVTRQGNGFYYKGQRIQQSNALLLEAMIRQQNVDAAALEKTLKIEQYGQDQLVQALQDNNLQGIDDVCEQGFDLSKTHVLTAVCKMGNRPLAERLLAKGALVNKVYRDRLGIGFSTPLVGAILERHFDLARYLIEQHGADINIYINGYSPLMLACLSRDDTFINYLLDRGAILEQGIGSAAMMMAMLNDNEPLVRRLLASGKIELNKPATLPGNLGSSSQFPLWVAARDCLSEKYVRLLLDNGANPLVTPVSPHTLSRALDTELASVEGALLSLARSRDNSFLSLMLKPKESKEELEKKKQKLTAIRNIMLEAENKAAEKFNDVVAKKEQANKAFLDRLTDAIYHPTPGQNDDEVLQDITQQLRSLVRP